MVQLNKNLGKINSKINIAELIQKGTQKKKVKYTCQQLFSCADSERL
jgi:hypothetical protein